jgi:2-desacetyl-2-hydroxyethyl bacteriochlorophyllide A dehydrogenase
MHNPSVKKKVMKTLVCEQPGILAYAQKEVPVMEQGRAIIKIHRIGICGTDLHAYEGTQPYFNYPRILGHELSGELVECDQAIGFHPGQIVTFLPYFNCGTCIACRHGKTNCCTSLQVCGVHIDGGMVEYLSVPAGNLIDGTGLNYDELALVEPLAIGAHGIRRAEVKKDEFVLVIGAGPIGLGTMEFARIAGGRVIALDINEHRLHFCKDKLNIPYTINALTGQVTDRLMEITQGDMPTVVIDATGSLKAIDAAFQYIAHGGRYILIGLQKGDITVSHPQFHKREATLMSSRNATREDFNHVISHLKLKNIFPHNYITHRIGFDDLQNSFQRLLDPDNRVIKAMVEI